MAVEVPGNVTGFARKHYQRQFAAGPASGCKGERGINDLPDGPSWPTPGQIIRTDRNTRRRSAGDEAKYLVGWPRWPTTRSDHRGVDPRQMLGKWRLLK